MWRISRRRGALGAAAGTVIVLALAGCGGGSGDYPVEVTGQMVDCNNDLAMAFTCQEDASDDRVSGESQVDFTCTTAGAVTTCTSDVVLTNDGGTWEGTVEGTATEEGDEGALFHEFDAEMLGTGDYDGLRYTAHWEGYDWPWELTGTIDEVG
ncbi:hypothetical protein [Demequina maris]|uniref:hypothetical protein n=1 Tax=Demequina maris TaxID=1638982 RepID=UPI000781F664|nr:hypothetical protein [Demequina maris]